MLNNEWKFFEGNGPVLGVALHAGNKIRNSITPYLKINPEERKREEDPLTDLWALSCDNVFINQTSRFEYDLNRPREKAIYLTADDAWGIDVWNEPLPDLEVEKSLKLYDDFYSRIKTKIDFLIARHGNLLLLDIHSYNHQREGEGKFAELSKNPDIDLGLTTCDKEKFKDSIKALTDVFKEGKINGKEISVDENVRYPGGGYFPEWVYSLYKEHICCVTLEVKKIYIDEWTGAIDLAAVEELRDLIQKAVFEAKKVLP